MLHRSTLLFFFFFSFSHLCRMFVGRVCRQSCSSARIYPRISGDSTKLQGDFFFFSVRFSVCKFTICEIEGCGIRFRLGSFTLNVVPYLASGSSQFCLVLAISILCISGTQQPLKLRRPFNVNFLSLLSLARQTILFRLKGGLTSGDERFHRPGQICSEGYLPLLVKLTSICI